ncbi:MAG: FAD-dependent oxidoreductase [Clostridiales bacterium]|jgi:NAD(P)H-nitrite reductase large subunit|nr:FAD-dependent oxidoreductase [Clostridiales bacterium]
MKYVIIGNSIASTGCIEGIRATDKDGSITVIGAEPHHVYGRPLISYLLEGKTDLERIKYRPDDFYEVNKCEFLSGVRAVKIDLKDKVVETENGGTIPYDKLLIATGSRPFVPRITGLEKYEYHTFMTLDDALRLDKKIRETANAKVLIIGAGLIGLKCAEALRKYASKITVVDMADRVLPSILDAEGAEIIKKHLEANGVDFVLSTAANLDDFKFDILCVCAGVIPETGLAKAAGLEVGRGIFIDDRAATTAIDVYAAGDCTESVSGVTGARGATPILPNAYIQGETAGINMAGGRAVCDKYIPMNAIGFFGKHILTAGVYDGETVTVKRDGGFKKLFIKDGLLKGYIFIDDFKRAGIYTALIRDKTDLSGIDSDALADDISLARVYKKNRRDEILKKTDLRGQGV